jgi:hypothetical protein
MVQRKIPSVNFSTQDCIAVLENMQERTKHYDKMYPHFSKEYCEELAGMDCLVLNLTIEKLKAYEEMSKKITAGNAFITPLNISTIVLACISITLSMISILF